MSSGDSAGQLGKTGTGEQATDTQQSYEQEEARGKHRGSQKAMGVPRQVQTDHHCKGWGSVSEKEPAFVGYMAIS